MSDEVLGLMSGLVIALFIVGLIIFPISFGITFHERCKAAGYEAAELELCIRRVRDGGPVYKENLEYWDD